MATTKQIAWRKYQRYKKQQKVWKKKMIAELKKQEKAKANKS